MKPVYKIRNYKTGLFSTGGTTPSWNKKGKTWSKIAHVHSHLNLVDKSDYNEFCEIVEYELVETSCVGVQIKLDAIHMARIEKNIAYQKRVDEAHKKRRLEEYNKLKREFENV